MNKVHVCMFSTGLSSAYIAHLLIKEYGKEDVILFMTDTLWEDEDNYRFMREVSNYLGKSITVLADGRTPEEVFFDSKFLGNFGTAPCSKALKMKQTAIFVEQLRSDGKEPILYFGIGKHESERAERISNNYSHYCLEPVECRYPLVNIEMTNDMLTAIIHGQWGIKRPRMYDYGFKHANCGGRCVKAGIEHYRLLYHVWPERFADQEKMERRFRSEINDYTILKKYTGTDKDGNSVYAPYSLEQLRADIESKGYIQTDMYIDAGMEIPCACIA